MTDTRQATGGGVRELLRGGAGIAVAMGVMNVATYGFQMVAARLLGPEAYGAIAGLMALAARRGGAPARAPGDRRPPDLRRRPTTSRRSRTSSSASPTAAAIGLGVVLLVASPAVWSLLRLDSIVPAILLAVAAVPLTIMGGQAGILQGERRWCPLAVVYLAMGLPRLVIGTICILISPTETSAMFGVMLGAVRAGRARLVRPAPGPRARRHQRRPRARADRPGDRAQLGQALLAFFVLSNADIARRPQRPRRPRRRPVRRRPDPHQGGAVPAAVRRRRGVPVDVDAATGAGADPQPRRRAGRRAGAAPSPPWCCSRVALVFVGGPQYAEVQSPAVGVRDPRHAAVDAAAARLLRAGPPELALDVPDLGRGPRAGRPRASGSARCTPCWPPSPRSTPCCSRCSSRWPCGTSPRRASTARRPSPPGRQQR